MVEDQKWQMSFSLQPHQHANGHLHLWIQLRPWPTQFRKGLFFLGWFCLQPLDRGREFTSS